MTKKIGAVDQMSRGDIVVESLSGLTNAECAENIANHFAKISNEYLPMVVLPYISTIKSEAVIQTY